MGESLLRKFLFAYMPLFIRSRPGKRELQNILRRMKREDRDFFDPVALKLKPGFIQLIGEAEQIAGRVAPLFIGNLEGTGDELNNFLKSLCSDLLSIGNLAFDKLTLINIAVELGERAPVGAIDDVFKSRMKYFTSRNFAVVRSLLKIYSTYAAIVNYDFKALTGEALKKTIRAEDVLEELKGLLYLVRALPPQFKSIKADPVLAAILTDDALKEGMTTEKLQGDLNRLHQIFTGCLSEEFLTDLISLVSRSPISDDRRFNTDFTFPAEIHDQLAKQYRIDRDIYIANENEKILLSRMKTLFGERHLLDLENYNKMTSDLFLQAGLPPLKYEIPLRIIKSFATYYFTPIILSILREFQLESDFFDKEEKGKFQASIEKFEEILLKIEKFEEDLTIPSFSLLLPFIEGLRNGFLDNKTKAKAREAIRTVNRRADKLIQATFGAAVNLHGAFVCINADMDDKAPKIISNVLYLRKNDNLAEGMNETADIINRFIKLLGIFSVHIDKARKNIGEPEKVN